jgi:hypothetical protein
MPDQEKVLRRWFEITIIEHAEVVAEVKEWKQIADTGNEKDNGPVYGYVYSQGSQVLTAARLEQKIDQMDVRRVLCAVNGLPYGEPSPAPEKPRKTRRDKGTKKSPVQNLDGHEGTTQ